MPWITAKKKEKSDMPDADFFLVFDILFSLFFLNKMYVMYRQFRCNTWFNLPIDGYTEREEKKLNATNLLCVRAQWYTDHHGYAALIYAMYRRKETSFSHYLS